MECKEVVRQLKSELKEANEKYISTHQRIAELHRLQADIEQANIKVIVSSSLSVL